jgi:hypothetical protein
VRAERVADSLARTAPQVPSPAPLEPAGAEATAADSLPPHAAWMMTHLGLREGTGPGGDYNNTGELICSWLEAVGVGCPNPWCGAQVSRGLEKYDVESPDVRSALVMDFKREASRDYALRSGQLPPVGALVLFRWSAQAQHIGVVVARTGDDTFLTVSGNTGAPDGSCSGCGVFLSERHVTPANYYAPVRAIPVTY